MHCPFAAIRLTGGCDALFHRWLVVRGPKGRDVAWERQCMIACRDMSPESDTTSLHIRDNSTDDAKPR